MRFVILMVVLILTFSLSTGVALAEQKGSPFKDLILGMLGYTKKTVEKEVNTVGGGIKKSADVVTQEVKDVGALATGDVSKTKDVLVNPVTGTAEIVGETAHGVITAPIEAGKEVGKKSAEPETK